MSNDVLQYLQNAGNHPTSWILIYAPLGLAIALAFIAGLFISFKRRKQTRDLEKEYTSQEFSSKPVEIKSEESWLEKLKAGLSRTKDSLTSGLIQVFSGPAQIEEGLLEKVHEELYRADIGVKSADRLVSGLRKEFLGQAVDWDMVRKSLLRQVSEIFTEIDHPINTPQSGPFVILIVGVNGVGKTTTIGKLALHFKSQGKSVMLCAADTFRAAAIEQLQIWGERHDVPVIKQHSGADPAAVAFDGVQAAKARSADVLIIDTAGRLHSKVELMAELTKIGKSIGKGLPEAPHETWIVLDSTTGQNAVQQCKAFHEATKLTGIVMTKLDGTAKGGVIIGIAEQFKLPIRFIGVGEKATDLKDFNGAAFAEGVFGV